MAQLGLQLTQKMTVSQVQRLTIQMMTLHGQDLRDFLQEQVVSNPLLDIQYGDVYTKGTSSSGDKPLDAVQSHGDSWDEKLMKQLRLQRVPKAVLMAGALIIQHLDDKGFFTEDLVSLGESYHLTADVMAKGLALVQSFDPAGIGATSLQECLLLQARRLPQAPDRTIDVLTMCYDAFLHGKWEGIQEQLHISRKRLQEINRFLKTLSLQPIAAVAATAEYIRPDIEFYVATDDVVQVRFLEELPQVRFRQDLYQQYTAQGDGATRQFVRKAKQQFLDLESALAYRRQSIQTVAAYIGQYQREYFTQGHSLRPLLQVEIAAATGLSTATVSRVCRDRYVLWQGQVVPLQRFFARSYDHLQSESGVISDQAIKENITALIAAEDKGHPLSDQAIMERFKAKGIPIARRTIAKFRAALQIPNSTMRRRIHALQQS